MGHVGTRYTKQTCKGDRMKGGVVLLLVVLLVCSLVVEGNAKSAKKKKEQKVKSVEDKKKDNKDRDMLFFMKQMLKEKGITCEDCKTTSDYMAKLSSHMKGERSRPVDEKEWAEQKLKKDYMMGEDDKFWEGEAPKIAEDKMLPLEHLVRIQELLKKKDKGVPLLDILKEAKAEGIDVEKLLDKKIPALYESNTECNCKAEEGQSGCSMPIMDDGALHHDEEEEFY